MLGRIITVDELSPLRRKAVKNKLSARAEDVPPRTRGDFRGVGGNPHPFLINSGYPPQVPPWKRGDDLRPTSSPGGVQR